MLDITSIVTMHPNSTIQGGPAISTVSSNQIFLICLTFFLTFINDLSKIVRHASTIDSVQDFLIKFDIKPLIHLLEINIFSIYNDLVRLTKIMNNFVKDLKILSFKVIFECLKLVESFKKKIL